MDLFPYNFDLEYYIEEIYSRQQIGIATATEPPTFLYDSNIGIGKQNTILIFIDAAILWNSFVEKST
jgi:hypothetical protein